MHTHLGLGTRLWCVGFFAWCFASNPASLTVFAGPAREEAMGIVEQGMEVSGSGHLTSAMDLFRRVEREFPEEGEAVRWSWYRLSESYWAGLNWPEAARYARQCWEAARADLSAPTDQVFWCGFQYVRCLDKLGIRDLQEEVSWETLELLSRWGEPDAPRKEAGGWLHYFHAVSLYSRGAFASAEEAAHQAWEIGRSVQNGALASWAHLLEGRSAMGTGNLLGAEAVLRFCLTEYAPHQSESYGGEIRIRLAGCQAAMGRFAEAHASVLAMQHNPAIDRGLRAEALVCLAESALKESATADAVRALAVAVTLYPDAPAWGDIARDRWNRVLARERETRLREASEDGSPLERAAVLLERARNAEDAEERIRLASEAEALAEGTPLEAPAALFLSGMTGEPASPGEISRLLLEKTLSEVRGKHFRGGADRAYREWLEAQAEALPPVTFLLEKAWYLRQAKAPEDLDYPGALLLLDEVLRTATDPQDRLSALRGRIETLYLAGRDPEALEAVEDLLREVCAAPEREKALLMAGDTLKPVRLDPALMLFDLVIASGQDPVWLREALLLKGQALCSRGRSTEGREVLEQLAAMEPLSEGGGRLVGGALLHLALSHRSQGDYARAREYYEQVITAPDRYPGSLENAYAEYVVTTRLLQDWELSVEVCDRGIEALGNRNSGVCGSLKLSRAKALMALGRTDEAVATLLEVATRSPDPALRNQAADYVQVITQ